MCTHLRIHYGIPALVEAQVTSVRQKREADCVVELLIQEVGQVMRP